MELIVVDSEGSEQTLPSPTVEGSGWAEPNRVVRQISSGSGGACLDPLTPRAVATRQTMSAAALRNMGKRRPWAHPVTAEEMCPSASMDLENMSNSTTTTNSSQSTNSPPLVPHNRQNDTHDYIPAGQSEPVDPVNIRHGRLEFAGDKREVVNEQACCVSDAHIAPWAVVRARRDQYQSMRKPSYRFARLEGLRKTIHMMQHEWKLETPSLIISVTGDASKSFDLRPEYHRMFTHALVKASLRTKAWIITGGSNRGIMKAMGDALGSYHATTPCIGIATWGTIHGRPGFEEPSAGYVYDASIRATSINPRDQNGETNMRTVLPVSVECITEDVHERLAAMAAKLCKGPDGAAGINGLTTGQLGAAVQRDPVLQNLSAQQLRAWLQEQQQDVVVQNEKTWIDPNHSHYIFVDDGSIGQYQAEVAFRAELEDMISHCGFDVGADSTRYENHRMRVLVDVFREHLDAADFEAVDAQTVDFSTFERLVHKAWQSSFCRQSSDSISKSDFVGNLARQESFGLDPSPSSRRAVPVRVRPRMRSTMSVSTAHAAAPQDPPRLRRCPTGQRNVWMSPEELRMIFDLIDNDETGEVLVEKLLQLLDEDAFLDHVPSRRMMPVVLFVYGGGAGTFRTIDEAVGRGHSIIVVPQSGRAAHAIHKWKQAPSSGSEQEKEQRLLTLFSEEEISSFTSAVRGGKTGLIGLLDDICSYSSLYFFELDSETTSNDLLDLMVRSLIDSPAIDESVKVPLALQYDATPAIRMLLARGGITKSDGAVPDALADCRPYLFAAYHDKAETCRHLLDYGVDKNALDRLILCELRSDEISQRMRKMFLTRKHLAEPPPWWAGSNDDWSNLDRGERENAYLPEPDDWKQHRDGAWSSLPLESQIDTHLFAHCAVTWSKLFGPTRNKSSIIGQHQVSGKDQDLDSDVVATVLPLDNKALFSAQELFRGGHSLLSEQRTQSAFARWTTGQNQRPTDLEGCGCCPSHTDDLVDDFDSDSRSSNMDLLSVSGPQSYSLWYSDYGSMYERACENPLSDIHRVFWAVTTRRYKLARLLWERSHDPVAAAFAAAWAFRNLPDAHMNEDDRESEANSYDHAATAIIKGFQESADAKQETAFLQQYLYFSNTDNVDQHRSNTSIGQQPSETQPRVLNRLWSMPAESMRNIFDGKRRDVLADGTYSANSKGSPHPLYGCLSASQRMQNTAIRDGLILMGFEGLEPTRLDMAVTARCKMVLSLDSVEEFMDMLWTRPTCGRTRILERVLLGGVSPQLKCKLHIASELLFLMLFVSVFFGVEPGHAGVSWVTEPTNVQVEGLFWFWVGSLVIEELRQLYHAGRSALYIQSSVNKLDVVIMIIFILAFGFHLFELHHLGGAAADWIVQLHVSSHRIFHGLLCCDIILVAVRLLYMLAAVSRRLAILLIMTKRMIFEDVRPFLVFAAFVVVSFELAAYHFSHTLGVSHRFLSFFGLLLDVGELDGIDPRGPFHAELPDWDVPPLEWRIWLGVFKVIYVVVAVVVLMNLLIAMMSNTYSRIQEQSTTEWRLLFAELVKEYTETPLLPPPLSVLQYAIAGAVKLLMRCPRWRTPAVESHFFADACGSKGAKDCEWGRHLSPTTSFMLAFQLDVATETALRGCRDGSSGATTVQ